VAALLLAMALILTPKPSQSQRSTTDTMQALRSTLLLYQTCKLDAEDRWCEGYLTGLADILLALGNSRMPGGICGAEYDSGTLRRLFESWVERHPESSSNDMAISAQAAFRERWPCRHAREPSRTGAAPLSSIRSTETSSRGISLQTSFRNRGGWHA